MVTRTYLGTSGWHYQDWVEPVYSKEEAEQEWLPYYSRIFNFVNINMTYYKEKIPQEFVRRWYGQTPPNFKFVVKANQKFTHKQSFNPQKFSQWMKQFQDLQEKQLGFLLQFPQSVVRSKQLLSAIKQIQSESIVFVEFRNRSWYYPPPETDPAVLVIPDTPTISTLPGRATSIRSTNQDIIFVRLHGRNRFRWYEHREARERYDYYYPPAEIKYLTQRMASNKSLIIIDANNHPLGQAPLNIIDTRRAMGEKLSEPEKKLERRITAILAHRLQREKMGKLNAYYPRAEESDWNTALKTDLSAKIRVATPYVIAGTSEGVEVYIDRCEKRIFCQKTSHRGMLCEHLRALLKEVGEEKPHVILEDYKDIMGIMGTKS